MPDHVHFFARRATVARPMTHWMKMWKSGSSRSALKIAAPIWQPEYFDRYLRSRENYAQKWNYVEQNALRAGLIKEGEEWPYCGSIFDLMW
jgi:REP element-mobilizing transposase RayT